MKKRVKVIILFLALVAIFIIAIFMIEEFIKLKNKKAYDAMIIDAKKMCLSTGGAWGFTECGGGLLCIPKTREERLKWETGGEPAGCLAAVCRVGDICACPNGKKWGSTKEGCIDY